jgi:exo-1,4-beta-D-glucosaminidase
MTLEVDAEGRSSDSDTMRFGIREITSELNAQSYRVFKVNGRNILIRGGGWAPDMLLTASAEREAAEIRYVKDMNLNAIRFEGKTESRRFLEMCDREGILVIAGWCCCDHWEKWANWDAEDMEVSAISLRDQIKRIRNHPSILTWLNGSDNPPPANVEQRYIEVLKACNWPNPYQSSATAKPTGVTGLTGLKMTGPYEWVPPHYWYVDTKHGGAYGFNTETSPGPAVPPIESLRRMLPADHLWPIDDFWNFHCGGGSFKTLQVFSEAISNRLGAASSAEDYARKAQLMAYEGERAMFEAYARNKYLSTGVIQWMMNNAWPSMIWHLYDYYLRPGGGYFGTKKACEPLHIQYSYDDRSVVVVNGTYQQANGLKASAKLYNIDFMEKFSKEVQLDSPADSSKGVFVVSETENLSKTYFLRLRLEDAKGKLMSSNLYWLSSRPETLNEEKANWYMTPAKSFVDFSGLNNLTRATLNGKARLEQGAEEWSVHVSLENPTRSLAFFVRLKLTNGSSGEEVLPILWQDNYVSLWSGEKLEITARIKPAQLGSQAPALEIEGWNVDRTIWPIAR